VFLSFLFVVSFYMTNDLSATVTPPPSVPIHDEATVAGTRLQTRYFRHLVTRTHTQLLRYTVKRSSDALGPTTTTFGFIQTIYRSTARLSTPSPGMVISEGYRASCDSVEHSREYHCWLSLTAIAQSMH
jgi:hypothetical protein